MSILISLLLQAAASAPPANSEVVVTLPEDDKIVCRTITATGSRLGGKRVCMSKKDWKRADKEAQDTTRTYQDNQSKQPGNQ